ncbi:MAG: radical SAM protein, partial [Anaerolineae bacterium]|nr:radical SAM protein [Anaerolineae bacterium]
AGAKLTGGEPTLHPQFVPIVDMLTAAGLSITMETNGTLVDADLARYLAQHTALTFVAVSIDGPTAEIHDPFRGVAGSFDAALRGVRHLVAAGYRPQVIASIHRGNLARVEEIVQLALELGAGSVKFNPVMRVGRGTAMYERGEALDPLEIIDLAHFVRGPLQQQMPIRLILSTPLAFYTAGELLRLGNDSQCQIRHILGILGSGDMALCGIGQTIPQLCFGNLREVGVAEVWVNHPFLRQLREDLSGDYPGICGQCIHAPRCLAYCVAQNYFDRGELVSPPTMCVEAQRQGRFPASRLRQGK